MNKFIIIIILLMGCHGVSAQSILGKWKSIDDETGEAKSIVEIYEKNGKVYGKIVDILTAKRDALCNKCKGKNKDKPVLGMVIIEGLEKEDNVYEGGTIINPENGKEYKCQLKIEEDKDTLRVRGYVAFFYKTQYWKRVE
ncbi:DUF2147 domain-containing protein [Winogradskyella sp. HB-48]|uniref:DUF2147 domain-containing protein n=1 Tax=Winogradskyella sp. HB-48 TaxID=3416808 RepID=UPI003CF49ECB